MSDGLGDGAALAAPAPEVRGPGRPWQSAPRAEWEVEGGMKGGEASSPAAREGGGGGEVFLWAGPWTPLEGWMGFRGPAPLRTAPPPVGSVCRGGGGVIFSAECRRVLPHEDGEGEVRGHRWVRGDRCFRVLVTR